MCFDSIIHNLQKRHFDAFYVKDKEEAVSLALSLIQKGSTVTWGGTKTLEEIGLSDALKRGDYRVFDRNTVSPEEKQAFTERHFFSDWFIMSANALTEEGELINMDGRGNRVASLIYGPKNVLVLVGKNKIVSDFEEGVRRVREYAAPKNAQRFSIATPCRQTGKCGNCLSP
ncbi:MAG: lactate utilization protein, partial [Clostridia bacterium]|nr:lactate utilization protein [Clostridia bacterium]